MFTGKFDWKLISLCNHKFFVSTFSPFLILTSFFCANYFYIFLYFTSFNFSDALIFPDFFFIRSYFLSFTSFFVHLLSVLFRSTFLLPCFSCYLSLIFFYIYLFYCFIFHDSFSFYSCLQIFCKLYLFLFFNILHLTSIFVSFLSAFDF